MSQENDPTMRSATGMDDFTKVVFRPVSAQFHMKNLGDNDTVNLMTRRAYDVSAENHFALVKYQSYPDITFILQITDCWHIVWCVGVFEWCFGRSRKIRWLH